MTTATARRTWERTPAPTRSPWGQVDYATEIAPGIWTVGTPSHGGIKLSRARNAAVPAVHRREGGWYEEDCDWALTAITFPEEWRAHMARQEWYTGGDIVESAWTTIIGGARWDYAEERRARIVAAGGAVRSAGVGIDPVDGIEMVRAHFETAAGRHSHAATMAAEVYGAAGWNEPEKETHAYFLEVAARLGLPCGPLEVARD